MVIGGRVCDGSFSMAHLWMISVQFGDSYMTRSIRKHTRWGRYHTKKSGNGSVDHNNLNIIPLRVHMGCVGLVDV
jgi:hypothetical protein